MPKLIPSSRICWPWATFGLVVAAGAVGCDEEPVAIFVAPCLDEGACGPGEICVDGACAPRDSLACSKVDGGRAILQPSPPAVDFGRVGGGTARAELLVRNIGDCTLTFFDAFFSSAESSPFQCPQCARERFPLELLPFEEDALEIFFTPPGIGAQEDMLVLVSDDVELEEIRVPVRASFDGVPSLSFVPAEIDFGYTQVGRTKTRTVRVMNRGTGTAPLEVHGAWVESATASPFSLLEGLDEPVVLRPFDPSEGSLSDLVLTVRYRPLDLAAHSGALVVSAAGPGEADSQVVLRGTSERPPEIAVDPLEVRFGPVPLGQTASAPITILNTGGAPLEVRARWGGAGLTTDLSARPARIAPLSAGAFGPLMVEVTATRPGAIQGLLLLESNDPRRPSITVPVSAEGREVPGAEVVKVEMTFENDSDSSLDSDLRDIDLALESPAGLVCDERNPSPVDWMAHGQPTWLAFPPKEEPERIILRDAQQDGIYRVALSYQEDCASVPTDLAAAVLGISVDLLLDAVTGGGLPGLTSGEITSVIEALCLSRRGTSATVTVSVNGEVRAEVPVRLAERGQRVAAVTLERRDGVFAVRR